jgi:PAS domain S-box-containing protein
MCHTCRVVPLEEFGADVEDALERVRVPAYLIDPAGVIRWVNPAAERIVGNVRGRQLTSVLAPEERRRGREIFARNLMGPPEGSDNVGILLTADGERITVELSAVPLKDGSQVVGVFGQFKDVVEEETSAPAHPDLTPRQWEILRLLKQGRTTDQITSELHLSRETVRNHIAALLKTLGVHSRIEAVALTHADH